MAGIIVSGYFGYSGKQWVSAVSLAGGVGRRCWVVGIIVSRYLGYSGKPWVSAVSLVGGGG